MKLKAWYDVVKPREDLREGKPLDASEFAVHLDKVRLGTAPDDYKIPQRFFDRTYLTANLTGLAAEVVRRLSGLTTETSAVFNMTTQFGGGKTHALTLLYHLAKSGSAASSYRGVNKILDRAGVTSIPDNCALAVFVGTEFDSLTGRGGDDGSPCRKTPWGELAWQLGGADSFAHVAQHDADFIEPKGDVIAKMIPADRPCLILLDEVLNYVSTYRDRGLHNKLYNFIQSLSETIRGLPNAVLVGSIPASELSYTDKDHADQQRLKNLLDRLGKAIIVSVEGETSEIIRRRLFEWDDRAMTADGRVILNRDAEDVCRAYSDWISEHRQQLPNLINPDVARDQFRATYPFHPMVISVFERKWQTLPRFQQTRGVLRLLALWVSTVYREGYKGALRDPLITLGTAPLDDATFRAAVFEQLGETKLEGAVTADIAGRKDSHAVRLDVEAIDPIKKASLHRKVATTIFFESNGGQIGAETHEASVPEIRLAVGHPESDIGNVETVLDSLTEACYYLTVEKTRYRFGVKENLNKRFADRRATVNVSQVDDEVKREILRIFAPRESVDRIFFPEKSAQIPDRPQITFVILDLDHTIEDERGVFEFVDQMLRNCGNSSRTFKSAVIFMVADSVQAMRDEARNLLAWQTIEDESLDLKLDEQQRKQLNENSQKARRDLKESIWRGYKQLLLLGKDNSLRRIDLGLVHSSAAESPITNVINRLMADGDFEKGVSPNFLIRNWPPAFKEWSTRKVRDDFFSSPIFPRLLNADSIKDTIARGIENGMIAYVGKVAPDRYQPFIYKQSISADEIEFSDDVFLITGDAAQSYLNQQERVEPADTKASIGLGSNIVTTLSSSEKGGAEALPPTSPADSAVTQSGRIPGVQWAGEVPAQKWMNFYTKVLSRFATVTGLRIRIQIEISPAEGLSRQQIDDTRNALKELGLNDGIAEDRRPG